MNLFHAHIQHHELNLCRFKSQHFVALLKNPIDDPIDLVMVQQKANKWILSWSKCYVQHRQSWKGYDWNHNGQHSHLHHWRLCHTITNCCWDCVFSFFIVFCVSELKWGGGCVCVSVPVCDWILAPQRRPMLLWVDDRTQEVNKVNEAVWLGGF